MELFAPAYYNKFKCIANKCRHSCCIDWEIDIDEKTLSKYNSIGGTLSENIEEDDRGAHIRLCGDGRCPFLNDEGLCEIIIAHGESMLSDICREHPRFYNLLAGRAEVGLGLVCEEACRLILSDDTPVSLVKIGESFDFEGTVSAYPDMMVHRDEIFKLLEKSDMSFDEKLRCLENKYEVSPYIYSTQEWLRVFSELEILDSEWKTLLGNASGKSQVSEVEGFDAIYERLLKYLVYRHVSAASDFCNLKARLGFSMLCAIIVKRIFESGMDHSIEGLLSLIRLFSSEIEYSEENTASLIFEFESALF